MRAILQQSWKTYCEHFSVIVAAVVAVWAPLELLSSYMDTFVFGENDFRTSWHFAQFLDNSFGIVATAAVIFSGHEAMTGQRATFRSALAAGLNSWGRMWWTRVLSRLAIVVGFLLLIIPGVYLLVRLSLVAPVAVHERISGSAAMRRSFALTEGRFWFVFRLGVVLLGLLILPVAVIALPSAFIPALHHWLVGAATRLICDIVAAFWPIALVTAYLHFNNEQSGSSTAAAGDSVNSTL